MKFLQILILWFPLMVHAQTKKPEAVNTKKMYMYDYTFRLDHKADTNSYNLKTFYGNKTSIIWVRDSKNEGIPFVQFRLVRTETDSMLILSTDIDGKCSTQLQPGSYTLTINYPEYDSLRMEFKLEELIHEEVIDSVTVKEIHEPAQLELEIKLGLAPGLDVWNIHTRKKLTEEEYQSIIKCVEENQRDFFDHCSKPGEYLITIQI